MTMMTLSSDEPRTVARTMANGRNGITRNQSVTRSRTAPAHVPKCPDAMPTSVRDACAPHHEREHRAAGLVGAQRVAR
jgi:hypothetical protein